MSVVGKQRGSPGFRTPREPGLRVLPRSSEIVRPVRDCRAPRCGEGSQCLGTPGLGRVKTKRTTGRRRSAAPARRGGSAAGGAVELEAGGRGGVAGVVGLISDGGRASRRQGTVVAGV